jgi:hypothetical protein
MKLLKKMKKKRSDNEIISIKKVRGEKKGSAQDTEEGESEAKEKVRDVTSLHFFHRSYKHIRFRIIIMMGLCIER